MTPHDFLTQRSGCHPIPIREAFSSSRVEITKPTTWQCAERGFGALSPIWDVFTKPLPLQPKDGEKIWRGGRESVETEGIDGSKETASSKHNRADARMKSVSARPAQIQTRQISWWRRGSGHKISPLTKKLFTINTCWETESQFSSGVTLGISKY